MTRRKKWVLGILGGLVIAIVALGFLLPMVAGKYFVGLHMKSTTNELRNWGEEYSKVGSDGEAFRAIEVMEYMSRYYVPGSGYRGPKEVEEALQKQREASLKQVADALEKHTGNAYGTDVAKWKEWARSKGYKERE